MRTTNLTKTSRSVRFSHITKVSPRDHARTTAPSLRSNRHKGSDMPHPPCQVGDVLDFEYPSIGSPQSPGWERHIVTVETVIDTNSIPIAAKARATNSPSGRWLIVAINEDTGNAVSFFWDAMRHVSATAWLQLALYDPLDSDTPPILRSRLFAPTAENRRYLSEVIAIYNDSVANREDKLHNLGVFACEVRHESTTNAGH